MRTNVVNEMSEKKGEKLVLQRNAVLGLRQFIDTDQTPCVLTVH